MAMLPSSSGGRSGRRSSRRAPMADINVTPLVDVMLVLLIIFMVTAPLMMAGVPVNLPDSRAQPLNQETAEPLQLALDGTGRIYIGEQEIAPSDLPARLEAFALAPAADGEEPAVLLRADKALDYGRVMAVMGELNRAGLNRVSLVTTGSVEAP